MISLLVGLWGKADKPHIGVKDMQKAMGLVVVGALALASAAGCAYSGAATTGDKVVVLRNDGFLFGALRKAYVCKVTDNGLTNCVTGETP